MADSQATTMSDESSGGDKTHRQSGMDLDLEAYPLIFVLPARMEADLDQLKAKLKSMYARLTDHIRDAQLILTAVRQSTRAEYELQSRKLRLGPLDTVIATPVIKQELPQTPPKQRNNKAKNLIDSGSTRRSFQGTDTDSDVETVATDVTDDPSNTARRLDGMDGIDDQLTQFHERTLVKVVHVEWFEESLTSRRIQHLEPYTIMQGTRLPETKNGNISTMRRISIKRDPEGTPELSRESKKIRVDNGRRSVTTSPQYSSKNMSYRRKHHKPALLRETTSDHDQVSVREVPDWVRDNLIYACQRITPQHGPNDDFLNELRVIRHKRELTDDDIGVRSYSTAIASLAAYPYPLANTKEILALPGCEQKIAQLFRQWKDDQKLDEAEEMRTDTYLRVIDEFWNIHGVGPKVAHKLYAKGFRDTDDIVSQGWTDLTKEQQIGLKYYDEFQQKIPRTESEQIASVIVQHAKALIGDDAQHMIVGGYRKGKEMSGDVDIVISHCDQSKTLNLIDPLVESLMNDGWIVHELELHQGYSRHGQQPVPANILREGPSFDQLDKALVVWQNPAWPSKEEDLKADLKAKNPAIHRRVDIIISPWKTVGCAVLGWSSGTTFQRDLRRYAKYVKKWKFDSTGARDRITGDWIDLEKWRDPNTRATSIEEAERRVFEGLGLEYRHPWERCTD